MLSGFKNNIYDTTNKYDSKTQDEFKKFIMKKSRKKKQKKKRKKK